MKKKSQADKILEHLERVGFITPLTALNEYGCFRLAAIIHALRKKHLIKTNRTVTNWAVYSLTTYYTDKRIATFKKMKSNVLLRESEVEK